MSHAATGALVLNATYEPLCVVSIRRAAVLIITEKAESVTDGEVIYRSTSFVLIAPVVLRLRRHVRVPFRQVALTRRAVFVRDQGKCAYCGSSANTIDHVIPRSRGGRHCWDNVVAACIGCNRLKADNSLAELGWRLHRAPRMPRGVGWGIFGAKPVDPRWLGWLPGVDQASA